MSESKPQENFQQQSARIIKSKTTQQPVPQYGVSQPICIKMPTERELRLTHGVNS